MSGTAASPKRKSTPLSRNLVFNLIILLAVGVGVSGWILVYTDLFPLVGGLLTLGGLFSWLAFVSRILPQEITEQLQQGFADTLSKGGVLVILLVLVLCLGAAGSFFGAIHLEVQSTEPIHEFYLYREGSRSPERRAIPLEGSSNIPLPAVFGVSRWRIKIPGYPALDPPASVFPFGRMTLYAPQSFRRRVLLIVPSNELVQSRYGYTLRLNVDLGSGRKMVIDEYRWTAFWVGCNEDVQVPATMQALLRAEKAQLRVILKPDQYPPLLDVSLNKPFADPKWLGKGSTDTDLEFAVPSQIRITGETKIGDVTDADEQQGTAAEAVRSSVQWKEVLNKNVAPETSNSSFVQVVYLEKQDWATPKN